MLLPWQIARFDQVDAAIRELIRRFDPSVDLSPGVGELPDDPFLESW